MSEKIEFVNREEAERLAARFVELQEASGEARVESWKALAGAAELVGPASNTGEKYIYWHKRGERKPEYRIQMKRADGTQMTAAMAAPAESEARTSPLLARAIAKRDELVAQRKAEGQEPELKRSSSLSAALEALVAATLAGRAWLDRVKPTTARTRLGNIVRVVDAYGDEGLYPAAGLSAHVTFVTYPNRVELVRKYPSTDTASTAVARMSRGAAIPKKAIPRRYIGRVSGGGRNCSATLARALLKDVLGGASVAQLRRSLNLALEIAEEVERDVRAAESGEALDRAA